MALSKRAHDALGVLEQEAQGNPAAASALASVSRALSGHSGDDRDTPGRRQSKEITKEGKDNLTSRPGRASGDEPKASSGGSSSSSATAPNSPKEDAFKAFAERRRRGSARKG